VVVMATGRSTNPVARGMSVLIASGEWEELSKSSLIGGTVRMQGQSWAATRAD
jgi:hypothetical protein